MAGWKNFILDKGFPAAAALTQYRAVKMVAGTGTYGPSITPVTAVTDVVAGVAQEACTSAEATALRHVPMTVVGATPWECSAAIAVGVLCTVVADGRVVTAVTGSRVVGVCYHATTAAGQQATIVFMPGLALAP